MPKFIKEAPTWIALFVFVIYVAFAMVGVPAAIIYTLYNVPAHIKANVEAIKVKESLRCQ